MTRVCREDWAIGIAEAVAARGDCSRRRVGAVIFDREWRVLSVGYNGSYPGGPSCLEGKCPRAFSDVESGSSYDTVPGACHAVHAEANALMYADPLRRRGGTLALTTAPCDGCARLIRGVGIVNVIWPGWRERRY